MDATGDVGRYSAIALDGGGKVHISYYNETSGDLMYAAGSFGSWTREAEGRFNRKSKVYTLWTFS